VAALAERFPTFRCLTFVDRDGAEAHVTLSTLWARAREAEGLLRASGLPPGKAVLLALPTSMDLVAAYLGTMLAGGIPGLLATPSNRVADEGVYAARVGAILANARAHALYAAPEIAAIVRGAGPDVLAGARLVTPDELGAPSRAPLPAVGPDDVATVQYSSGSTGTPKGILLTHRAMLDNVRAVRDGLGLVPADVSVNWIPLYHDMGLIDAFLLPLLTGCPTVLIPTMDFMRDPALWLWAMHRYGGAISWAPNFAYTLCAHRVPDEDLAGLDLSSWRIAINAAEPVLAPTIEAFTRRFAAYGFRPEAMTPAWGLAENVTIATAHPVAVPPRVEHIDREALATDGVARPGDASGVASVAIGRCLPRSEIEIRDARGTALPDRHVGTIWLRTQSLFLGYHRDEARTRQTLIDGWLDTGDQGYVAGGDLFFVSRDKDLIVIGGEKYAPHDVETAINRVPGVRQGCAVAFGVLNEERGTEELAAIVETRVDGDAERAALEQALRAEVLRAIGLALRHVILVPPGGVEKTTSGKLARRASRHRWAERLPETHV
jgi:acyl-CoA synthetase (AMP-forming)/AMP-acid ligase II